MSAEQTIGALIFGLAGIILIFVAVWLRGRRERNIPRIYHHLPDRDPEPLAAAVQQAIVATEELRAAILQGNSAMVYTETANVGIHCHYLAVELERRQQAAEQP